MIRLSRTGRNNFPTFSIVVTEKTNPVNDGNFVEKLGHFLPAQEPPVVVVEKARVEYWISKGAKPSETVARLLKKQGMVGMEKFVDFTKKYQRKKKAGKEAAAVPVTGADVKVTEAKA